MCVYQDDYMHGARIRRVSSIWTVEGAKDAPRRPRFTSDDHDRFAERHRAVRAGKGSQEFDADTIRRLRTWCWRGRWTTGDYTTAANAAGAVISAGYSLMNEEQYTTSGFQSTSLPRPSGATRVLLHVARQPFLRIVHVDHGCGQCANNKGIYMAIDDQLYNQIAATDRKKNFNATETTVGEFTYPAYSNVKFNTPTYEADEIYMRLSEAYLLKAEAESLAATVPQLSRRFNDLVSPARFGLCKVLEYGRSTAEGDLPAEPYRTLG